MNKVFENIVIHYNYIWERYAGKVISIGSLGGAIYTGTLLSEGHEKPRFRDTAMFVGWGAVAGALGSFLLLGTYPIVIPATVFVGPIHLYNEYKYESKRINSRTDKHELK